MPEEVILPRCSTDEQLRMEQERREIALEKFQSRLDCAYERARTIKKDLDPEGFALGFIAGYEDSR